MLNSKIDHQVSTSLAKPEMSNNKENRNYLSSGKGDSANGESRPDQDNTLKFDSSQSILLRTVKQHSEAVGGAQQKDELVTTINQATLSRESDE